MEEKRHEPRFRIRQLIAYGPTREEYVFAEGINLSHTGLSCRSAQLVEPMTNVFLMIKVPGAEGERQVRCEGYVSHSHMIEGQCVFGVRITEVYEGDRPYLEAFIASLEAEEP